MIIGNINKTQQEKTVVSVKECKDSAWVSWHGAGKAQRPNPQKIAFTVQPLWKSLNSYRR